MQELVAHLIIKCRFLPQVWNALISYLGPHASMMLSPHFETTMSWLKEVLKNWQPRKSLHSLLLLIGWGISKERNLCVFQNKVRSMAVIVRLIQDEASLWAIVGAKHLSNLMQDSNFESLWLLFYKLLLLINMQTCTELSSVKKIHCKLLTARTSTALRYM